jgi:hypothetical protein
MEFSSAMCLSFSAAAKNAKFAVISWKKLRLAKMQISFQFQRSRIHIVFFGTKRQKKGQQDRVEFISYLFAKASWAKNNESCNHFFWYVRVRRKSSSSGFGKLPRFLLFGQNTNLKN